MTIIASKFDTNFRGGVEDTRLEAKAKDTDHGQEIRGHGPTSRGQTLLMPRTGGMLDAKAKDTTRKTCSTKKRSLGRKL